jgi:hypothetical protein
MTTRASKHAERERIAQWMIANSLATGHGDTIEDLLGEAAGQIKELHKKNAELVAALTELRERILQGKGNVGHVTVIDAVLAKPKASP